MKQPRACSAACACSCATRSRSTGVAKRLEPSRNGRGAAEQNGDGEVSVVLLLQNGSEVEVKLPGRFKVSPQIAGAIKAVTGVVTVEAL